MANLFRRWSSIDSARSLADWVLWIFLGLLGTSGATVTAVAATYTHWYWQEYGYIGLVFAAVASAISLLILVILCLYSTYMFLKIRESWQGNALQKSISEMRSEAKESRDRAWEFSAKFHQYKQQSSDLIQKCDEIIRQMNLSIEHNIFAQNAHARLVDNHNEILIKAKERLEEVNSQARCDFPDKWSSMYKSQSPRYCIPTRKKELSGRAHLLKNTWTENYIPLRPILKTPNYS